MTAFAALAPLREKLAAGQEDLAAELIETIGRFRVELITTAALAEEAPAWLNRRMSALAAVITDEERYPRNERDHEWLDGAEAVLELATALLIQVNRKRAMLRAAA